VGEAVQSSPPLSAAPEVTAVPVGRAPTGPGALAPLRRTRLFAFVRRQYGEAYVQLLIAQLFVGATAAVANILMSRALAPSSRGLIALLLQVAYLSSQVLLLGSERSFVARFHGSSPSSGVRAYTRLIVVPCAVGLGIVAVAAAVVPARLRPAAPVIALVAVFAVVNVLVQASRAVAIATGRQTGYLRSTLFSQSTLLVAMAVLLLNGVGRPLMWFAVYMICGAVPTIACGVVWSRTRTAAASMSGAAVSEYDQRRAVRREGLALFPAAVANMAMLRVDRLVLPALPSTAALGLYATVSTLTELLSWPLQAYADARVGRWRAAHVVGRLRVSPAIVGAALYVLVVGPLFGTAVYLVIVPLFGERYASATGLVPPLVAAAGLYAISRITLGMLIGLGRNLLASTAEVAGFVASFAGYLLLIPTHGAAGAAYASLIGYGTCLVVALACVVRRGDGRAPVPGEGR
jgi:O-antigen/teichoic acid export membrane protein